MTFVTLIQEAWMLEDGQSAARTARRETVVEDRRQRTILQSAVRLRDLSGCRWLSCAHLSSESLPPGAGKDYGKRVRAR